MFFQFSSIILFLFAFPLGDLLVPTISLQLKQNLPSNNTECRCRDSLILVDFYRATDGENWKETWDLTDTMETWKGVELDFRGCVTGLTINANELNGTLPENFGDLADLKKLSLGNNALSGNLPQSMGDLKNLESINFRTNQFSGTIPLDLGNLSKLKTLNLSVNEFEGTIPIELYDLNNLTGLFLNQNNLTGGISPFIGKLENLVSLNMSSNQLEGEIPKEIGGLLSLTGIGLNRNNLTGNLPASLGNLMNLVSFRIEDNQLSGALPAELGNLQKVESLFFHNNNFSGCFPETFKTFCSLIESTTTFGRGYSFRGNPQLSWEGDFSQFCEGLPQIGASCNDGLESTLVDAITEDCTCSLMEEIIPQITLATNITATCSNENEGAVDFAILPSDLTYKIVWLDPNRNETETESSNTFQLSNLSAGTYEITFTDVNDNNLILTETFEIPSLNCFDESKIPQLITPNEDGLNEQFIFDDLDNNPNLYPNNELIIFNRWGDIVFKAKPYLNDWSGKNQSGQMLPQGTYYYVFRLDFNEGLIIKGDITVVR